MNVEKKQLINYFSEKLGVTPRTLETYINNPTNEYYDLEYYLSMAYNWHAISYDLIRGLFLSYIPSKKNLVLDIGCGPGLYHKMLLERAEKHIGIDMSHSAIEMAKQIFRNNSKMTFIEGNACNIDLPDASADLIFCTEVIEHITDNIPLFMNFHRILKPNGKIFLTTTTFYYYIAHILVFFGYKDIYKNLDFKTFLHRLRLYFAAFKGPSQRTQFMREGLERLDHVHAFTFPQLKEIFDDTGFNIVKYDYFNCKDIFPVSKLFSPVNLTLKKLFKTSKVYGPNIAVLLSPR